ncbi:MAG: hypothetical protein H6737_25060 [Alphaproteobacteria bacterium]|nr:hypothetical protein [Alphaproteobacteria bacterium]
MADEPHDESTFEPAPLADALALLVKRALRRSRQELSRAADGQRRRLELRQKRRDLEHFWIRLGKTAHRLVEAGEIDHPALRKAMTRIAELEAELEETEARHRDVAHASESE